MTKKFKLSSSQMRNLAPGRGACIATDTITVDGQRVGFMYRDEPDNDIDSGWRFTSGDESDEYMNAPENLSVFDVNTIANYDPDIVFFLDADVGSAFERSETGQFIEVAFDPESLH
jgi:hypothetical protein